MCPSFPPKSHLRSRHGLRSPLLLHKKSEYEAICSEKQMEEWDMTVLVFFKFVNSMRMCASSLLPGCIQGWEWSARLFLSRLKITTRGTMCFVPKLQKTRCMTVPVLAESRCTGIHGGRASKIHDGHHMRKTPAFLRNLNSRLRLMCAPLLLSKFTTTHPCLRSSSLKNIP
jgi:hypothetical protein